MYSVRKWMFRPKKTDTSLLAQFFFADEELNAVASELDKFDGRKDPERCTRWVNRLRTCQDRVLAVVENVMDDALSDCYRSSRDFRVKFPDDVLQESLSGQLWFGAECLAAGSSILNREAESASMRPLAKAMTRQLDYVRNTLREQCLRNLNYYTDEIRDALVVFDRLFAEFELSYVSAMVPVKTMKEYDILQEVIVLFSDTVQRALKLNLLTQEMLEDCDPALMFAIPRLAIICGLLVYPEGPLNPDMDPLDMSEMFRPFQTLLYKIRELLWTLDCRELRKLEIILCKNNSPSTPDVSGGHFDYMDVTTGGSSSGQDATSSVDPSSTTAEPPGLQLCDQSQYCAYLHMNSLDSDDADAMSQSVSVDTVIVNATTDDKYLSPDGADESPERTQGSTSSSMQHQDSVDSGLLSGSDGVPPVTSLSWQHSNVVKARCLRHSLSWPELSKRRVRQCTHELNTRRRNSILEGLNLGSSSTFDASMFSPLGGSTGVMEVTRYQHLVSMDQAVIPNGISDVSPRHCIVCATADNVDSDDGLQVSYVTPTLSDVFLTDTTFQNEHGGFPADVASSHSDTQEDVAMETTGALATASGDICDTTNSDKDAATNHDSKSTHGTHPGSATRGQGPSKSSDAAVSSSAPMSSRKQSRDNRRAHKSRRTDLHVTLSHDGYQSAEGKGAEHRTWEQGSNASSDTSSYTSACHDDEEIAMAIQAAELAARQEARSRFKNSSDLIHRLFVCISGVADQLQTNYAGDLRNVLKAVFDINCPPEEVDDNDSDKDGCDSPTAVSGDNSSGDMNAEETESESGTETRTFGVAPPWIPDDQVTHCTGCQVAFSFVRRKHHCRNCGKIFCGRCSCNSAPLPHFGFEKAVRVCNHCFMFELTPFTTDTYE